MLVMMAAGMDQISAFSAIATCMNNLGPGLGSVAPLSFVYKAFDIAYNRDAAP